MSEADAATYSVRDDVSRWSESLSLVNKATMRNIDQFSRTGFNKRPPRAKKGSLNNIPSAFDTVDNRGTMYNNYLSDHSVEDTLATLNKYQNNLVSRSLTPSRRGDNFQNEEVYYQQQRSRQRQPFPTSGGLIKPAESFYFKERSNSAARPNTISLGDELNYKSTLERAKDDLELYSKALENNLK